jgi:hypothetical protein
MKHRRIPKPSLATLPTRTIYTLIQRFCQLHPLPKNRGRPPKYSEVLILTLLCLGVRDQASYRRLRFVLARELFPDQPLPALGTRAYRFHPIAEARWQQLLNWLALQGIADEPAPAERP